MATIGLRKLYYARLTEDTETTTTYETPKRLAGLINVEINPSIQKNTLYGDDMPLATASSISEITVTLETADIPLADAAAMLGHSLDSGTMLVKASDTSPYVAILFEAEKHDGQTRYVKLLKGKFDEGQESLQTRGESVEYTTPKLEGTFVARTSDGAWKMVKDTSDTTVATSWYASV
ncbi:MAG: hypothetical protein IJ668_00015 [Selenomonadaceae bacterium]|nr:hypothetical protein [Selenomonadaceae bacterium]